jgi:hypothetical protein
MTELPEQDLTAERNAAKFSRTKEFAEIKTYLTGRIQFYQDYLPHGEPVLAASQEDLLALGQRWVVANAIIGELTAIISAYEQAAEVVKADAARRQNS